MIAPIIHNIYWTEPGLSPKMDGVVKPSLGRGCPARPDVQEVLEKEGAKMHGSEE